MLPSQGVRGNTREFFETSLNTSVPGVLVYPVGGPRKYYMLRTRLGVMELSDTTSGLHFSSTQVRGEVSGVASA